MELVESDSAEAVKQVLVKYHVWDDMSYWAPLGGIENNGGTVKSQQGDGLKALTELLINALDATLLNKCKEHGIDPESDKAPSTLIEARETFYGLDEKAFRNLGGKDRSTLASETCHLVTTGKDKTLCFSIIDHGEGQCPEDFTDTFLALSGSNKNKIKFVQGKFCLGSAGALEFSKSGLRLIVSRRNPKINDKGSGEWGVTIIRKFRPSESNSKTSNFRFLCKQMDGNRPEIFRFSKPDGLPLAPTKEKATGKILPYGTFTKLFDYSVKAVASTATRDLSYKLQTLLVDPILPIRIYERRPEKMTANVPETTLSGLRHRLRESERLEDGFPISGSFTITEFRDGRFDFHLWVLKEHENTDRKNTNSPTHHYRNKREGVIFTLNGQQHHSLSEYTFNKARLPNLKDSMILEIDCTHIGFDNIDTLFKSDRENFSRSDYKKLFEKKIADELQKIDRLKQLEKERLEKKIADLVADTEKINELFQKFLDDNPALAKYLFHGRDINSKALTSKDELPVEFQGKYHPTFLEEWKETTKTKRKNCSKGKSAQIKFRTDAQNDYFTRLDDKGKLKLECETHTWPEISGQTLANGELNITVELPDWLEVGSKLDLVFSFVDDYLINPVEETCYIEIIEPAETTGDSRDKKPKKNGLTAPEIIPLKRDNWSRQNFNEKTLVRIEESGDDVIIYVNADHSNLINEKYLQSKQGNNMPAELEPTFIHSAVIFGLLAKQHEETLAQFSPDHETEFLSNEDKNGGIYELADLFAPSIIPIIKLVMDRAKGR